MIKNLIFAFLVISLVSGCGTVQIENRAFVTAIGLDTAGEGPEAKYLVTVEIFRPGTMQPHTQEPPVIIQSVEAENFQTALEQLQARLARKITLAHLSLVVVGEDAAKQFDFRQIADYFQRHPEVQMRTRLLAVQNGQALDILKTEPLFEDYISEELVGMAEMWPYLSLTRRNPFFGFVGDLRTTGGRGLLPRVMKTDEGEIIIRHGGAVFDNYKLVGWLSNNEIQAANWLLENTQVPVTGRLEDSDYSYLVNRSRVKIIPEAENEQIRFKVSIMTDGILRQQQSSHIDMSDPENINRLETVFAQAIANQTQSAIDKAQQDFGIDYLGFESALRRHLPRVSENIEWEENFPNIPVTVEVESRLSRFGKTR